MRKLRGALESLFALCIKSGSLCQRVSYLGSRIQILMLRWIIRQIGMTLVGICSGLLMQAYSQNWENPAIVLDRGAVVTYHDSIGDALYFGGNFLWLNGQPAAGVAKFDGLQWTALPPGNPIGAVRGITMFQEKLLVYGFGGIGIWDGVQWDSITSMAVVYEMRPIGTNELLVAGIFNALDGDSVTSLAIWDGDRFYDTYGTHLQFDLDYFRLSKTMEYGGRLYIAGNIDVSDSLKEIACWNGNKWLSVGGGIGGGGMAHINDMEIFQGELYVGGYFFEQDGSPGNCIARWNGQRWDRVGDGLGSGQVFELFNFDGKLYVSGAFSYANGMVANCIATWDGNEWCTLGHQIDNVISCMHDYHGDLYIGGGFHTIDDDSILFVAKWIGGSFTDSCMVVPVGFSESVGIQGISLYPNPTHATFTIALPHNPIAIGSPAAQLRVLDLAGREALAPWKYAGGEVDVAPLAAGLYFVEVMLRGKKQVIKLVKE